MRVPIRFKIQEDNRYNTKALHVTKEIKRHGSMKRGRRAAGSRAYIVGARYYHGNKLMSTVLGYGSRGQQQRTVLRALRGSSKVSLQLSMSCIHNIVKCQLFLNFFQNKAKSFPKCMVVLESLKKLR